MKCAGTSKRRARPTLCWRAIVDGLRPISNDIWEELSMDDRQRFVRHLKKYWEPHRHRMAPEIRERLDGYQASGALQIIAGRLQERSPERPVSQLRRFAEEGGERVVSNVDRIISCTGIQESYTNSPRPLIRSLMEKGTGAGERSGNGVPDRRAGRFAGVRTCPRHRFSSRSVRRAAESSSKRPPYRKFGTQAEALAHRWCKAASRPGSKLRIQFTIANGPGIPGAIGGCRQSWGQ
jgi:hypothetical protein